MEPNIKSSVCVRLTPKCRDSVELVQKNSSSPKQIRLIDRNSNDFDLYKVHEVYSFFQQSYGKETANKTLYESMIGTDEMNSFTDLESSLYCFLGSQGVGKTFTMTGQLKNLFKNSGLLGHLMQQIFKSSDDIQSQSKISTSHSKLNSVEVRFLQIMDENVQNIGFETVNGREVANRIDYKTDIKSLAHFENCIRKVYERKKPQMHLVIQVTLKKDPIILVTNSTTLTFIEISSSCFDDGNANSQKLKVQVENLIAVFQNIQRIKHLEHLFEGSKLTKVLKNNFFQARKVILIGILDNCFKGNQMTLKWLTMQILSKCRSLEFKEDNSMIQSMKQNIKKSEEYLKNLMDKHKKVMNILSKCTGTDLSCWDKQKNGVTSKRQIDFGFGNSFSKSHEKIKLANLKKQQNEEFIQKLNKQIATIEGEINFMENEHREAMEKLNLEKNVIVCVKNNMISKMEKMANQLIDRNLISSNEAGKNVGNLLLLRQSLDMGNTKNTGNGCNRGGFQQDFKENMLSKQQISQNSSLKTSAKNINITSKAKVDSENKQSTQIETKMLKQEQVGISSQLFLQRQKSIVKNEAKREIYELFRLISEQEKSLEQVMKSSSQKLSTGLVNRIKNRQQLGLRKIKKYLVEKYLKQGKDIDARLYHQYVQNQIAFAEISKNIHSIPKKNEQTSHANLKRA